MVNKALAAVGAMTVFLSPTTVNVAEGQAGTSDAQLSYGQFQIQNKGTGKCLRAGRTGGARVTTVTCRKSDDWQWWAFYNGNKPYSVAVAGRLLCMKSLKFPRMGNCLAHTRWSGPVDTDYQAVGAWDPAAPWPGCSLKVDKRDHVKCTPGFTSKYAQWRQVRP